MLIGWSSMFSPGLTSIVRGFPNDKLSANSSSNGQGSNSWTSDRQPRGPFIDRSRPDHEHRVQHIVPDREHQGGIMVLENEGCDDRPGGRPLKSQISSLKRISASVSEGASPRLCTSIVSEIDRQHAPKGLKRPDDLCHLPRAIGDPDQGEPGFPQLNAISDDSMPMTLSVLKRCKLAGVNDFTVMIGLAMVEKPATSATGAPLPTSMKPWVSVEPVAQL